MSASKSLESVTSPPTTCRSLPAICLLALQQLRDYGRRPDLSCLVVLGGFASLQNETLDVVEEGW